MNNDANEMVTDILRQIKDEESVKRFGLSGARNLDRGDPSKVIYSLTLYEHVGDAKPTCLEGGKWHVPLRKLPLLEKG